MDARRRRVPVDTLRALKPSGVLFLGQLITIARKAG
jgi:hypothetical protein